METILQGKLGGGESDCFLAATYTRDIHILYLVTFLTDKCPGWLFYKNIAIKVTNYHLSLLHGENNPKGGISVLRGFNNAKSFPIYSPIPSFFSIHDRARQYIKVEVTI